MTLRAIPCTHIYQLLQLWKFSYNLSEILHAKIEAGKTVIGLLLSSQTHRRGAEMAGKIALVRSHRLIRFTLWEDRQVNN